MSSFRRRLMSMMSAGEPIILPPGYTLYSWIKKSAYNDGAYINTGITYDQSLHFEVKFYNNNTHSSEGLQGTKSWRGSLLWRSDTNIRYYPSPPISFTYTFTVGEKGICVIKYGPDYMKINGADASSYSSNESGGGEIKFMCGYNAIGGFASKVFYYKIWNANMELLRHFVPCTDPNGIPGLFDLVSETFFANAASRGSFSVGL